MKIYRLTFIYTMATKNDPKRFKTTFFSEAKRVAIKRMKEDQKILAILIYSNENTQIVVKRSLKK